MKLEFDHIVDVILISEESHLVRIIQLKGVLFWVVLFIMHVGKDIEFEDLIWPKFNVFHQFASFDLIEYLLDNLRRQIVNTRKIFIQVF